MNKYTYLGLSFIQFGLTVSFAKDSLWLSSALSVAASTLWGYMWYMNQNRD